MVTQRIKSMLGSLYSSQPQGTQQTTVTETTLTPVPSGTQPPVVNIDVSVPPVAEATLGMSPVTREGMTVLTHLDQRSLLVLDVARREAIRIKKPTIEPEQLLLGLLADHEIFQLLEQFTLVAGNIVREIQSKEQPGTFDGQPSLGEDTKRLLEQAYVLAKERKMNYVMPEDILMAFLSGALQASNMLTAQGIQKDKVEAKLTKSTKYNFGSKSVLLEFGTDLTKLAEEGKLDPVAERENEIERTLHILLRRVKNNPVVIGNAGVGKTAIVEGIAQRIVEGKVPNDLKDKRIIQIDIASLIAGAAHRGEFEERLRNVIKEVRLSSGKIILFIDEIHTLIGAGQTEGALDASNIIKPFIARAQLQIIGSTTIAEYRRYIEKDKTLERRFQTVLVEEPTEEAAVNMITVLAPKYEAFHNVSYDRDAITEAVKLSKRYIGDRYLPDKAVDVLDEAAADVKLAEEFRKPPGSVKTQGDLPDKAPGSVSGVGQPQISTSNGETNPVPPQEKSVPGVPPVTQAQTPAPDVQTPVQGSPSTALPGTQIPKQLPKVVTSQDVEIVISKWTNIPITKLNEDESEKLLHLEDRIHTRLINQEIVVSAIAQSVRRGRIGLTNVNRPIASFIFLGPTGVGKTELAKTLAEILFGHEEAMIRLDMSEYMEKHEVAKLIGAPPGYVGYEEGGQLTEAVRVKPYSVLLFDEIEKAHADVFNILLQILEDGRLTDNKGNTISFKNTIIISTSNIGGSLIQQELQNKEKITPEDLKRVKGMVEGELHKFFKPELLNRFDDIMIFDPLGPKHMVEIASLQLKQTAKLLLEKQIVFTVEQKALAQLAKEGFDSAYGARPLRRLIQNSIENPIATSLIQKKFIAGDAIVVDFDEAADEYTFKKAPLPEPIPPTVVPQKSQSEPVPSPVPGVDEPSIVVPNQTPAPVDTNTSTPVAPVDQPATTTSDIPVPQPKSP